MAYVFQLFNDYLIWFLHDTTLLYLHVLDQMVRNGEDFRDGRKVFQRAKEIPAFRGGLKSLSFRAPLPVLRVSLAILHF